MIDITNRLAVVDLIEHRALADDVKRMAARDALFNELVRMCEEYRVALLLTKCPEKLMLGLDDLLKRARPLQS